MVKNSQFLWALLSSLYLFSCGGGVSGDNGSDPFNNGDASDTNTDTLSYKIGYFNQQGQFIEGQLGLSLDSNGVAQVSAGGSIGMTATVVDANNSRLQESISINFSSNCVVSGLASLTETLSTVNGQVSNTFIDSGCGGNSGTTDQITATVTLSDATVIQAIASLEVMPVAIGSISFSDLTSHQIVMFDTSDNTNNATTTATFVVKSDSDIPISGQEVSFSLTTEAGSLSLNKTIATSNSDGEVKVTLTAGTAPTLVRVIASVAGLNGETITSQSDQISVTTGLPTQRAFSLATDTYNPEGWSFDGEVASLTARLSDTFGNPVPDGTAILFSAEGGQIESQCLTSEGACSVTWTSANPRPDDGRVTIVAYAIGHESFIDSNGNNVFDATDGDAQTATGAVASGFEQAESLSAGFVDMSEAWRDDNEDNLHDSNEIFFDYNSDQRFNDANGAFDGPQCTATALCGTNTLHVRKALILVMAASRAYIDVQNSAGVAIASNYSSVDNPPTTEITRGQSSSFRVLLKDQNGNPLPAESSITIDTNSGTITFLGSDVVANTNRLGGTSTSFSLSNDLIEGDAASQAVVTLTITTPNQFVTGYTFTVNLL